MLAETVTAAEISQAIKTTLSLLAARAAPRVKEQILKWKTDAQAEKLQTNIRQIERITTIASRASSTIDEIYYPSRIKIGKLVYELWPLLPRFFPGTQKSL
jgi:hypothetical protein